MARDQFRVDLDYGEMELRSHRFLSEFDSSAESFISLRRCHRDPYASGFVDTLSDQFSSMSLLRPKPIRIPPPPWSLQGLRSKSLFTATNTSDAGSEVYQRFYYERSKLDPFYELHLSRLRNNESQEERARILQRQATRLQNGGLVHRNGNVLRKSVGTGVYHPLQRPTWETFSSVKKRNQSEKELM
ncbi:unnamed protein product [Microthlaspi erraticum]|uniref:Uncharacterized protein n=1 Tax=Microthlaspi erraticum TaxID=1685480 RepID=A0A6D2L5B8_9BRAS|nr:unnamed protein product [Microthlaspi erraticum]